MSKKRIAFYFINLLAFFFILVVVWLIRLNHKIQSQIESGWFRPPVEIYAQGEKLKVRQKLTAVELANRLRLLQFRERFEGQSLYPNDFSILTAAQCAELLKSPFQGDTTSCIYLNTVKPEQIALITFSDNGDLLQIFTGAAFNETQQIELAPQLFAQFYEGEPILRKLIRVGDTPIECLQAVTAIEDSQFLEHKGVSITGLFRAMARNLLSGRYAQGGSTITQQLVKNYFLTPEKTLRRKFLEMAMAILLETNTSKDQILENYLNVAYMGQKGPFQVIGFGSASEHYFSKPLHSLNLGECALLAAIINSPGRYNPLTSPERARTRRDLVLDRMVETEMIDSAQAQTAKTADLPTKRTSALQDPAPYYVQAVHRELERLQITKDEGLRVYTSLDPYAQDIAQKKLAEHLTRLETQFKSLAAKKSKQKNLEAALVSVDVSTGEVTALVGGRQFVKTQYNRVIDAHRQVGSIMKPFVYLAALESHTPDGAPYTPTTVIDDSRFQHKYQGQSWSPQNYDNKFYGQVPLFYALKNSLNSATAKLGLDIGVDKVVDVAKRAGVSSPIEPLPSLTLGAFELHPIEVAESYLTLARMGEHTSLTFIRSVEDLNGNALYKAHPETDTAFTNADVAVLLGMMKQTMRVGTGRSAAQYGFTRPSAGKTGTTSDTKDVWFAGFTPHVLAVAWTGYDDNTATGLTGASGALPLWLEFMKNYASRYPEDDFSWPEGTGPFQISPEIYKGMVPFAETYELEAPIELIRKTE